MPSRIGIEISPSGCRIVQVDRAAGSETDTIVRAFAHTSSADEVTLAPYRRQPVAVVLWGLHSDHRQAVVTVRSYQRMRREAVKATRQAGVDTTSMLADISPPIGKKGDGKRRPVVIALARTAEVAAAHRQLTAIGVRVRSIVTPALALMSLARLRRGLTVSGSIDAYVALEETATAIALVRDGGLVAARELDWGYQDSQGHAGARDEVVQQLGDAIDAFLGECGAPPSALSQVCVCGGMPELRSMTLALTERLDVEVEPLDSLFLIDEGHLPSDDFRERAADLRLAWAVAADWHAPINFLRERRRRLVKTMLTRAAVVAGVATGLGIAGIAWRLQGSMWLEPARPSAKPAAQPTPAPPPGAKPKPIPPQASALVVAPPPVAIAAPPPVAVAPPPPAAVAAPPPAPTLPPPTPVLRIPPQQPIQQPVVLTPVPTPARPVSPRESQTSPVIATSVAATPPVRRPPPEEVPLPFEAALGSILYGADRKLAIIDGRIVQVGDDVHGARVVEITPSSVLFRDQQGRLRRLALGNPGK